MAAALWADRDWPAAFHAYFTASKISFPYKLRVWVGYLQSQALELLLYLPLFLYLNGGPGMIQNKDRQ